MQTSAPHRWQLAREPRFVLFWWWTGSTTLSGLKIHVVNKMLWPFTTSARTTRSKPYLAKPKFWKLQLGKEKNKVHVLNKMLWLFIASAHGAGPFWLQCLSSDGEGVIHSPSCFSMKTWKPLGAIRAKLICVVRACTHVIYSRPCFGQRLLAWLTRVCYTSGNHGSICQIKSLFSIENYKTCADFDRTARKSVEKNAAAERTSFLRER